MRPKTDLGGETRPQMELWGGGGLTREACKNKLIVRSFLNKSTIKELVVK